MKCPKCNGKGDYFKEVYNDGKRRREILIKCNKCNGTGEVEMTNEEWFCQLSTEEKARFFADNDGTIQIGDDIDYKNTVTRWEKWLKQPHREE